MRISPIDPADDDAVRAWHDLLLACGRHDAPDSFVAASLEEVRGLLRGPAAGFSCAAWLGTEDGVPVASGWAASPLAPEAREAVHVLPRVLPGRRRAGHGSAMLAELSAHADRTGRPLHLATGIWGPEHGSDGAGSAVTGFAARHGFTIGQVDARRRLVLPVDAGVLADAETEAAAYHCDYRIRAWAGPIPEELVEDWAAMQTVFQADQPRGDLETVAAVITTEQIREDDRSLAASGQIKLNAIALGSDGAPVGYSDLVVTTGGSEPARQWETVVLRPHRGHRLGLGLKVALLRLLQRTRPDLRATITVNALSNAPMVAVNDRLGYEVVDYAGEFQRRPR